VTNVHLIKSSSGFQLVFETDSSFKFIPLRHEFKLDSPYLSEAFSKSEEEAIERVVRRELKSKESDDRIVRIVRNVLTQVYKNMYTRRGFWRDGLNAQDAN